MSMSRAEIELLIKARDEAKGTFDNLNKVIKETGSETDHASESMGKMGGKVKEAGAAGVAAGVVMANLAQIIGRQLVQGFKDSISAANELDRGLIGLSSVARAFHQDANLAQDAAKKLASDGLMTVGEAASGLKNLLAAGFGLDQAVVLMGRFKDSAAFGRQGALDFGQAIVGATEGIKNGNSALVDNAGVTKNLSVILQEAGFSANDLQKAQSDVNVRTAIFNGILRETNPQLGDTARFLDTAAGKQAQFNSQITISEQKIGKALQPALAGVIDTLTPMVQLVGNNADLFIHLGAAVSVVVAPLVAMKAAAALGIPPMAELGDKAIGAMISFQKAYTETGNLRGALGQLGTQSGITVGSLGLLKSAGLVAAAAFVGWQIGKIIADLTGLDKVVGDWLAHSAEAARSAETTAAKQDTLARATANAGRTITDYTEAIKINNAVNDIRQGQFVKTAAGQLKVIDAELYLGKITLEQANTQRASIEAEQHAQAVRQKRIGLTDVLAIKEKAFRDEIAATGYTQNELIGILKKDENGFNSWAKQVQLSDDTIKRLKDSLTDSTKGAKEHEQQLKKNEEAAKKFQESQDQLAQTMDKFGITTTRQVNKELADLVTQVDAARAAGVPMKVIVQSLGGEFLGLATRAHESKTEISGLMELFDQYANEAGLVLAPTKDFSGFMVKLPGQTSAMGDELKRLVPVLKAEADEQKRVNDLFEAFGLETPEALRKAAEAARQNYADLKATGLATTQQLKDAYDQMIEAQIKATGKLPGIWQTIIVPGVKGALMDIEHAASDSFAGMLTGATGFKDGFLNIWQALKNSARSILAELLDYFINSFIKGMIAAMAGQQGAWSNAFAGLTAGAGGGAGGGGGGYGQIIGDIIGSHTGAGGAGSYIHADVGSTAAKAGGSAAMGNLARFGGGGLMAAEGIYQLWKGKTKTAQIIGGVQAGAGIGTMIMPGVGTAIGAGVGALVGWYRSSRGPSKEEKEGREVVSDYEKHLASTLTDQQKLEAGGESWKASVIAVRDAYLKVGKSGADAEADVKALWDSSKGGAEAAAAAAAKIQLALDEVKKKADEGEAAEAAAAAAKQARIDKLTTQLTGLQAQSKTLMDSIANEAPEEVIGVFETSVREQVKALDIQADAVKKQIEDATAGATDAAGGITDAFHETTGHIGNDFGIDLTKIIFDTSLTAKKNMVIAADGIELGFHNALGGVITDLNDVGPEAQDTRAAVDAALRDLDYTAHVHFEVDPYPVVPGPGPRGGGLGLAAGGIYATGAAGVATWFGEGGEPEVGGPASFFKRIFEQLGVGENSQQPQGGNVELKVYITAQQVDRLTVERDVIPVIISALNNNKRQARTNARAALGIK